MFTNFQSITNSCESPCIEGNIVNAQTPTISEHPQPAIYTQNTSATPLTVTASVTDGGTLSYQWFSNTANNNTGGTTISGATGASYTPPTNTVNTRYYYVTVTNTNNNVYGIKVATATSNTAEVQVTTVPIVNAQTPSISEHPQPATYHQNATANALTVSASVTDGGALSFQWWSNTSNSNTGGSTISGATGASYTPPTATTGTRYYYVVVTNTNNSVNGTKTATARSNTAAVTITTESVINAATPIISSHPQPATTYTQNATATALTVAAPSPDGGTLSYQWYSNTANSNTNGSALSGATGASYTPPTTTVGTTYYYVVITNTNNSVNGTKTATAPSNTAAVTVTAPQQQVTGVEISDAPLARVYPNPTDGVITLEFESDGVFNLTFADMSGKALLRQTVSDRTVRIDLSNYPAGAYLLTIDDGKRQNTIRIVKN